MIEGFALLLAFVQGLRPMIEAALPVFLRIGGAMALLPVLGEASVPARIRLALTLALTLAATPALPPLAQPAIPAAALMAEPVIGLMLGFVLRVLVHALHLTGAIAAQAVSLSHLFSAPGIEPSPILSNALTMAALALFVLTGLHVEVVRLFVVSYQILPFGRLPEAADVAGMATAEVARAFALGVTLASPFVAVSLLFNLALGAINRAMPQLMVVFVGAPAITFLGILLLGVTAPLILAHWGQEMAAAIADPFGRLP